MVRPELEMSVHRASSALPLPNFAVTRYLLPVIAPARAPKSQLSGSEASIGRDGQYGENWFFCTIGCI